MRVACASCVPRRQVFLTHSLPASFFIQKRVVFAREHACEHELAKLNPTVGLRRIDGYAGTVERYFEVNNISSEQDTRATVPAARALEVDYLRVPQIVGNTGTDAKNRKTRTVL